MQSPAAPQADASGEAAALPLPTPDALPFWAEASPQTIPRAPRLTSAQSLALRDVTVLDEYGRTRALHMPLERPLTVFVDKRELVTLMTLGAQPELLVLGYLLNQRLVEHADEIESITVDWDVSAAAVRTRRSEPGARHIVRKIGTKTARRVVTTGCGQGTVYSDLLEDLSAVKLPAAQDARIRQSGLNSLLDRARQHPSVHRKAGSVHGCALFDMRGSEARMLVFVEDVGRHNAVDTIAGWMALHGVEGADKVFYTTGRLTSEMVMKSARMGVPIIVSRNGVTAMGHDLATQLGMTLFGRAAGRHFLLYSGFERFDSEPEQQRPAVRLVQPGDAEQAGSTG
jgi:FdhD protein